MFSFIDIIGHASNALFTIAAGFRNMFYLRIAMIVATLLELVYNFFITSTPLWTPIFWCIALIAMNLYQITSIFLNKKFLHLSNDEKLVYEMIGKEMDILNFKALIRKGVWEHDRSNLKLISEHQSVDNLYLLVKGRADVSLQNKHIAFIEPGNFIGEMSFLSQQLPGTTVELDANSTVVYWNKEELHTMLDKKTDIRHELHYILSDQLIRKLTHQNHLTVS